MAPSTRTQNVIVTVLAVLAIGLSGFAMWSVAQPHSSLVDGATATTRPATGSDNQAAATSTAAPTGDEDETTESATGETETATASNASVDSESTPSVESWVDAWSGEADLLVIGDGLSNMPNQWVQLWARQVGQDRPVQLHHWGERSNVSFNDPRVLSEAGGAALTVWSASRAGSSVADAAEHYERFVEASTTPDAVLVTLGHSSGREDVAAGLDALLDQIDETIPVLIAIGPEGLYADGVGDAFLDWAQDHDDRVSMLDIRPVAPAYPTAEQWALAFQEALDSP
ncbi:hypothetical protein [Ornithinimicrobium cryptoxanthini]|uniref:GDSL-like lipase/acylhydrolase family protein n=1 Tax=Ornithinimicrobium cryptoxanthini TaxID=2934161 RepID=A0ABY4YH54_9MICO|nr:hypothetical protein [Ornithinimicrobium cryptoxanthini]USQ76108.1 hypothetical protein NF557_16200 [Ornithinimicrobium cryptoxanthini]